MSRDRLERCHREAELEGQLQLAKLNGIPADVSPMFSARQIVCCHGDGVFWFRFVSYTSSAFCHGRVMIRCLYCHLPTKRSRFILSNHSSETHLIGTSSLQRFASHWDGNQANVTCQVPAWKFWLSLTLFSISAAQFWLAIEPAEYSAPFSPLFHSRFPSVVSSLLILLSFFLLPALSTLDIFKLKNSRQIRERKKKRNKWKKDGE